MSKLIKILAVVLGVLVLAVLLLPFVVDANRFRPMLESNLRDALHREVTLGDLSLSLVSGGVTATDLAIAEDPAFGKDPFLRAKSLHVGVELLPLVFHRRLHVTALTIQEPAVVLRQNTAGVWNFSSLGGGPAKTEPKTSDSGESLDLSVSRIDISDGHFTFNKLALEKVSLGVQDFSPTAAFPFKFQAAVVGGGQIDLSGKAGPLAADASRTPFDAHLTIAQFNLAGAGLGGQASLDGTAVSTAGKLDVSGKLKVDRARLVRGGSPSTKTLELDCTVSHDLESRTGTRCGRVISTSARPSRVSRALTIYRARSRAFI